MTANLHAMDWDHIRHFLAVVREGSVSRAAQRLEVNQTTVSRRIAALEAYFGKAVFQRNAGGWALTPLGERIAEAAEHMAERAETIERQVLADSQELSGRLRVTVADVCTQSLATPAFAAFARDYPGVDLEIIATNEELNLAAREADVALRTTDEPPANVVGKRITRLAYGIFGTREWLERVQSEAQPDVPCITWVGDGVSRAPWIEKSFPQSSRTHRTNSLGMVVRMCEQGLGLAQMPCAVGDTNPLLYRIPARFVETGWGLWVLSHVDLRTTARVRVLRDYLVAALEEQIDLIEGRQPHV